MAATVKACKVLVSNTRSSLLLPYILSDIFHTSRVSYSFSYAFRCDEANCCKVFQSGLTRNHITARWLHSSSSYSANKDYYKILGITRKASASEIKKSYYQLAKKYHPDTNKAADASRRFQEVSEAYEILSDESKKSQYDTWGSSSSQPPPGRSSGAGPSQQGFEGFHATIDPEELFRKIFGDATQFRKGFGQQAQGFADTIFGFGAASEVVMNLSFQEAARGVNKDIAVNVVDTCQYCKGSGAEYGSKVIKCPYCNGTGMESFSTGPFVMRGTCRKCHGKKVFIPRPCMECEGKGQSVQRKTVTVPVPAGVEDGQTVRMPVGKKEIFITFRVADSTYFTRDGADIYTDVNISLAQAALGGSIRIQGLHEDIDLRVPPGTSSHTTQRLAGKGVARVNSWGYGDHYVIIKIDVPRNLTTEQRNLLLAYAQTLKGTKGTIDGVAKDDKENCMDSEDVKQEEGFFATLKNKIFG
ncbi:PREDICTED: protein tumorous imaginal discs, mitochondrial-like [Priapulus caudatus]|uniref:Protein tumorous imaginal discs, mitochondrial-like n=1 Tax=Priapulus caudatus TaxID=37621 RepID=A0ABM1FBF8_PRICU|nr:PREDICTED: protein tumorous imaginal discs, mitochondrial-like [Priapulus caudatus]